MAYSDITENILKQMRTSGEPKTTTTKMTPQDPGAGGSQMGALLGMIIGGLLNKPGVGTTALGPARDLGPLPMGGTPGLSDLFTAGVPAAVVQPAGASQLSPEEFAALASKTPDELMQIYNYAVKMQAQEAALGGAPTLRGILR